MRFVDVRRHAPKHAEGALTSKGRDAARAMTRDMPDYTGVYASPKPRAVETAVLLTGRQPEYDSRAGTPPFTKAQEQELHEAGKNHVFGIAGVIFDRPDYRQLIRQQGTKLAELVAEILKKLPPDGSALIISHDGVMVAAEKVLKNEPFDKAGKTFRPLAGFRVSEDLTIEDIR